MTAFLWCFFERKRRYFGLKWRGVVARTPGEIHAHSLYLPRSELVVVSGFFLAPQERARSLWLMRVEPEPGERI